MRGFWALFLFYVTECNTLLDTQESDQGRVGDVSIEFFTDVVQDGLFNDSPHIQGITLDQCMFGWFKHIIDKIIPDLVDFSKVSSVQVSVGDGLGSLSLPLSSNQNRDSSGAAQTLCSLLLV